ncbi:MAG: hypothetical protein H6765_04685 [Candidatus Peribacteria bacterium]|nr:MAG: hypothetical protein H6765_04685 [Candidatus Peribacteria bacterium]
MFYRLSFALFITISVAVCCNAQALVIKSVNATNSLIITADPAYEGLAKQLTLQFQHAISHLDSTKVVVHLPSGVGYAKTTSDARYVYLDVDWDEKGQQLVTGYFICPDGFTGDIYIFANKKAMVPPARGAQFVKLGKRKPYTMNGFSPEQQEYFLLHVLPVLAPFL